MPNDYTKEAIKEAFIDLLNERPLNKISVKSIVDRCNVSRNTFYYHFQDIPKLLEEIIIEAANTMIRENSTMISMGKCIETAYDFAQRNKKAVYHIYHSIDRGAYEDFLMRMCDHTAHILVEEMAAGKDVSAEDRESIAYFVKCQFFGLCMDWTKGGMSDNIVEEYNRMIALFSRISGEIFRSEDSTLL